MEEALLLLNLIEVRVNQNAEAGKLWLQDVRHLWPVDRQAVL